MKQTICRNCGIPFEQADKGRRRLCRDCRGDNDMMPIGYRAARGIAPPIPGSMSVEEAIRRGRGGA
jgi:hypothetical protein